MKLVSVQASIAGRVRTRSPGLKGHSRLDKTVDEICVCQQQALGRSREEEPTLLARIAQFRTM